ncbi:Hypothetical predicted protein [Pelobates cultripes]|uniref:Uncharacterized protein n=1 Tax=Pelobates cultripes TaxID=61616 RepID=A0AAD1VSC6_PELCU|nr:Hypothetical predicted protein [Pelobates cultripes]
MYRTPYRKAADRISSLSWGDLRTPATKGDILSILQNLRTLFRSDMAILQEEVTTVTGRVKDAEEDNATKQRRRS